jgi:2-dehydro-3-deoxy-D-arabinonate dehydratase
MMTSRYLCRFHYHQGGARIGLVLEPDQPARAEVIDLTAAGNYRLAELLESDAALDRWAEEGLEGLPRLPLTQVSLLPPVDEQEVWAAGVTYQRSRQARMEESSFSASAYDRVYDAPRPELFFKALPAKVAAPGGPVGIRRDARWNVPEPELALFLNSQGRLIGCTIGNDMSSRDIEGENLLYLAQAKVYTHSCALGPWLRLGVTEAEARQWSIHLEIRRGDTVSFCGETTVGQIKRTFTELSDYLFRSQCFPAGVVLLTGTGIIPPDDFTLMPGDCVCIGVSGIGVLENRVAEV